MNLSASILFRISFLQESLPTNAAQPTISADRLRRPLNSNVRNQGEIEVIARIWKGWTTHENASIYEELFKNTVLPKVTQGLDGYVSTNLLRREIGENVEFTTVFWFESLDAVKNFAGPNFEQAVVPEQVKALMSDYEETVHHHDVAL